MIRSSRVGQKTRLVFLCSRSSILVNCNRFLPVSQCVCSFETSLRYRSLSASLASRNGCTKACQKLATKNLLVRNFWLLSFFLTPILASVQQGRLNLDHSQPYASSPMIGISRNAKPSSTFVSVFSARRLTNQHSQTELGAVSSQISRYLAFLGLCFTLVIVLSRRL